MFDKKNANPQSSNMDWKADAFVNIYLPRKDGTRMKLGFIALKGDHVEQKRVLDTLRADPEAIERLKSKIVLEFKDLEEASAELDF